MKRTQEERARIEMVRAAYCGIMEGTITDKDGLILTPGGLPDQISTEHCRRMRAHDPRLNTLTDAEISEIMQIEQEYGFMVFLEDVDDRDAAIEAFRSAGFHAIQLPGEFPQDDFLLVTKHHRADDNNTIHDLVCSIIRSYGRDVGGLSELGPDELDRVRAQAPRALN